MSIMGALYMEVNIEGVSNLFSILTETFTHRHLTTLLVTLAVNSEQPTVSSNLINIYQRIISRVISTLYQLYFADSTAIQLTIDAYHASSVCYKF